jgi:hypothetical protein
MRSILDESDRRQILRRLDAVSEEDAARWGRMSVSQMVCHLADQIRLLLGEMTARDRSRWFYRFLIKPLVLRGLLGIPRGGLRTFAEVDQASGGGTPATDLESDKATVRRKIDDFLVARKLHPHAMMGPLTRAEWGVMIHLHMDHHLRQFGR